MGAGRVCRGGPSSTSPATGATVGRPFLRPATSSPLPRRAASNHSNASAQAATSLRDDKGLYLASKSDEQLLIYIPLMQVVKLHSALFKGPDEEGEICYSLFEFCALRLDL